jgi:hypothetical protein
MHYPNWMRGGQLENFQVDYNSWWVACQRLSNLQKV